MLCFSSKLIVESQGIFPINRILYNQPNSSFCWTILCQDFIGQRIQNKSYTSRAKVISLCQNAFFFFPVGKAYRAHNQLYSVSRHAKNSPLNRWHTVKNSKKLFLGICVFVQHVGCAMCYLCYAQVMDAFKIQAMKVCGTVYLPLGRIVKRS